MSFEDEFEKHQQENEARNSSTSDFYRFFVGDHVMRIMSKPEKKASRFGYGICYEGAPYCDPEVTEREYQQKMEAYGNDFEKLRQSGATKKELQSLKKPTRANISVKWSVWALVRRQITKERDGKFKTHEVNELKIVDLPNGVAEALYNLKRDKDMGTAFDDFPMPYDVKVTVSQKKVKGTPTAKDIEYSLTPGQQRREIDAVVLAEFEKKTPVIQIIERMQEKKRDEDDGGAGDDDQSSGGIEYPKDDINPDDIPF